jgi:hypothetical protein
LTGLEIASRIFPTRRSNSLMRFIVGFFFVLHGLVHLLYFGQSRRLFELRPGMVWPDNSWVFSNLLGVEMTRLLASICCVLAAIAFVAAGVAVFAASPILRPLILSAAVFSSVLFVLFWDGKFHELDGQGGVAILINLAILVGLLILRWPDFGL